MTQAFGATAFANLRALRVFAVSLWMVGQGCKPGGERGAGRDGSSSPGRGTRIPLRFMTGYGLGNT
jgi:hypothetical protein